MAGAGCWGGCRRIVGRGFVGRGGGRGGGESLREGGRRGSEIGGEEGGLGGLWKR